MTNENVTARPFKLNGLTDGYLDNSVPNTARSDGSLTDHEKTILLVQTENRNNSSLINHEGRISLLENVLAKYDLKAMDETIEKHDKSISAFQVHLQDFVKAMSIVTAVITLSITLILFVLRVFNILGH